MGVILKKSRTVKNVFSSGFKNFVSFGVKISKWFSKPKLENRNREASVKIAFLKGRLIIFFTSS
ncbi:hypothetical protein AMJ49_00230 [Parcubacteria bacterium DG_74_2]|nr:MAG: hypothetical protein AMJ49_00230 [Parcubacteria bacterium DG_74_2]